MNNNNYEVGMQIQYTTTKVDGEYVPDRLGHTKLGYVAKTYYDGSVMVLNENDNYHMVEAEQIMGRVYNPSPLAVLLIEALESIMPLENWLLWILGTGVVIGILKHIGGMIL